MTTVDPLPAQKMLNVALLARTLGMQPVDLARELHADGIKVLPVSERSYRVGADDYAKWLDARQQRLADKFSQDARRGDYVRGDPDKPKRRASFKR